MIDYIAAAEEYRPARIRTLLVGEAPPPNGSSYFYVPTTLRQTKNIRDNRSLPATIFYHYFQSLPETGEQYREFLFRLMDRGVFLIDIVDEPIRVRNSPEGLRRVKEAIPKLREKMKRRKIEVPDDAIVFLLARKSYRKELGQEFPESQMTPWIDFRMGHAKK